MRVRTVEEAKKKIRYKKFQRDEIQMELEEIKKELKRLTKRRKILWKMESHINKHNIFLQGILIKGDCYTSDIQTLDSLDKEFYEYELELEEYR